MTVFNPDQLMDLLDWLTNLRDSGITLDEIIDGLTTGELTTNTGPERSNIRLAESA